MELTDGKFCAVSKVLDGGQGANLGFKVGDEFISVGGNKIPEDSSAFAKVMDYLKSLPRPVKVVIFRNKNWDPDAHTKSDTENISSRRIMARLG